MPHGGKKISGSQSFLIGDHMIKYLKFSPLCGWILHALTFFSCPKSGIVTCGRSRALTNVKIIVLLRHQSSLFKPHHYRFYYNLCDHLVFFHDATTFRVDGALCNNAFCRDVPHPVALFFFWRTDLCSRNFFLLCWSKFTRWMDFSTNEGNCGCTSLCIRRKTHGIISTESIITECFINSKGRCRTEGTRSQVPPPLFLESS